MNLIKNKSGRKNLNIDSNKLKPERNSRKLTMISKPTKQNSERGNLKRKARLVNTLEREIKWLSSGKTKKNRSSLKASRQE